MSSIIDGSDNFDSALRGLGVGQTYRDLTASRALVTDYVNTTDRPIYVTVMGTISSPVNSGLYPLVDGIEVGGNGGTHTDATARYFDVNFLVPAGSTYSVGIAGGPSVYNWIELRGD